jgi:hypothetical protein
MKKSGLSKRIVLVSSSPLLRYSVRWNLYWVLCFLVKGSIRSNVRNNNMPLTISSVLILLSVIQFVSLHCSILTGKFLQWTHCYIYCIAVQETIAFYCVNTLLAILPVALFFVFVLWYIFFLFWYMNLGNYNSIYNEKDQVPRS